MNTRITEAQLPPLPEAHGHIHDQHGNQPLSFDNGPTTLGRSLACSTLEVWSGAQMRAFALEAVTQWQAPKWKDHQTAEVINELTRVARKWHGTEQLRARIREAADPLILAAQPEPAAQDIEDAILAHLDALKDDAAAHIYPSDLERCNTSECVVEVVSVRCGNGIETTVPLFSRENVVEALHAARAATKPQGGA